MKPAFTVAGAKSEVPNMEQQEIVPPTATALRGLIFDVVTWGMSSPA